MTKSSSPSVLIGRGAPTRVGLKDRTDSGRAEAEAFVRRAFAEVHGAKVTQFMPLLMDLRNDQGDLLGVLGLRPAQGGDLFLERYLQQPVEQVLRERVGEVVERSGIMEVGNLAVCEAGGGRWLIVALTAFLHAMHKEWVVFTCGPQLGKAFSRLGLAPLDLGQARADQLSPEEAARWGRYYEQGPRVMAGRVEQGYQVLARLFEQECALHALWRCASLAGGRSQWG
jgi:hypothetical protein